MSVLLRMCPGDAWAFLIANVLFQVTVVILTAWLLARLMSRWNAAWRHSIYVVAVVCVLASPVLSWVMQTTGIALVTLRSSVPTAPEAEPARIPMAHIPESSPIETPAAPQVAARRASLEAENPVQGSQPENRSSPSFSDVLRAIGGGALVIWLLGMALLLARWCYGLHLIAALRRAARPLDSDAMAELMREVRRALGADRLPPMATSAGLDRPVLVGLIRPLVILPENVLRTLPEPELADILTHECAHAVCRHQVVGLLQRVARMLFWPHPLIHLLNRELARAREEVCDNYVLRRSDAPRYARTLLELSQLLVGVSPRPTALGLFHCHWRLEDRVADLLDRRRRVVIRVSGWTAATLTTTFLLLSLLIAGTRLVQAQAAAAKQETEAAAGKQEIVGRVLDYADKPIAGADVGLQGPQSYSPDELFTSRFVAVARTDSSGNFRLLVPERIDIGRGGWSVWAIADGYQPARPNRPNSPNHPTYSAPSRNSAGVRLAPSAGTIIRIVDTKGEPVPGVRVIVRSQTQKEDYHFPIPPDWLDRVAGVTDADGRARIANAIADAIAEVTLQPPGQSTSIRLDHNFFLNHHAAASSPHFTWALPAKGNIEGRLNVQGGKLPPDLKITIQTESRLPNDRKEATGPSGSATVAVDAEGRFRVADIAEGPIVVHPFLDEKQPLRAEIPVGVLVQPGKTTMLSIPVRRGVLVRGLIRKEDTKQGYPRFSLAVIYGQSARGQRNDMLEKLELETDASGRFSATVPPGPIVVRLYSAPGDYQDVQYLKPDREPGVNIFFGIRLSVETPASKQARSSQGRRSPLGTQFEVPAGDESFDLEPIELVPTDSITGKLVDLDGKPLWDDREWTVHGYPYHSGDGELNRGMSCFVDTVEDRDGHFSGSYPRTYPPVHWTAMRRRWPTPYQSVDETLDAKVISRNPFILQVPIHSREGSKGLKRGRS